MKLFARASPNKGRRKSRFGWKLTLLSLPLIGIFGVLTFYAVWAHTFDLKNVGDMPERNTVFDVDGKIYSRLAGYEDVNDAERLCLDPAMRTVVGGRAKDFQAASPSEMARFETEILSTPENLQLLMDLSGKWIDQAQSLNLYMKQPSGKKLDELYKHAWVSGLKTTYYLRTLGATHAEKTTITDDRLNKVAGKSNGNGASAKPVVAEAAPAYAAAANNGNGHAAPASDVGGAKVCSITDPDCEACQ